MWKASFTNRTQDITHMQTFASDDIGQTSPTRLNTSSTNTPAANPRLIGTTYQGIIPDQVSGSIGRQLHGLKWLSCTTHEDQDDQLLHTGSRIPFIYFDIHTSFHMYTLSTLGDFRLRITSFQSFPLSLRVWVSVSVSLSFSSVVSSLSLSLSHLNCD